MIKKCYVRMRGGLGNQLFQFSYAYLLCHKNRDYEIYLDTREFDNYYWPFCMNDFVLDGRTKTIHEKLKYDFAIKKYRLYRFLYKKFNKKHLSPNFLDKKLIKKGFLFSGTFCEFPNCELPEDIYLYGYFQNADLLKEIRANLVEIIRLKEPNQIVNSYLKRIDKNNSISISIRLAKEEEIKNNEKYVYSNKESYLSMLKEIIAKRNSNVQLVVSSNDIDRIKNEGWFEGYDRIVYLDNCNPSEQLAIIMECKDFILSNSTFSWWSAYLGSFNKNSIVIAPRVWLQGDDISQLKLLFDGMEIKDY